MKIERLVQLSVVLFFLLMVFAVFDTIRTIENTRDILREKKDIPTLPQKCGMYYNDGTERWKECMGVGYV